MESDDFEFDPAEAEETLQALYHPESYPLGESYCLHILEEIDDTWEPAKLYLLLNLAAQDAEEDALHMVDELEDESLFEALRQLAFGEGTEAEVQVYEDIMLCLEERGLEKPLEDFLQEKAQPLKRYSKVELPKRALP